MTPREELDRLRKMKRLRELEAKAGGNAPNSNPSGGGSYVRNAAESALQGATLGFSDEIIGGALTGAGKLFGNETLEDFGRTYADDHRARQEQFGETNPGSKFAADIGGSLLTGGAVAKAISPAIKAMSTLPRAVSYAGAGALTGGVTGAGYSDADTLGGRAEDAGLGAGIGALTGLAFPALLYGGRKLAGGLKSGVDRFTAAPITRAGRVLERAIGRDAMTPEELFARAQDMGPDATLADAAGDNVKGLLDTIVQQPGKARNDALRFLEQRQAGQHGRVEKMVADALKTPGSNPNIDAIQQSLHDTMRRIGEDYSPILNAGVAPMNDKLEKLMGSSSMKRALAQAYSILDDDIALGRADEKLREYFMFRDPMTGSISPVPGMAPGKQPFAPGVMRPSGAQFDPDNFELVKEPTLRVWDYVKRGLDAIIQDGTDPVSGKLSSQAERVLALKRALLENIDEVNPDYAKIRAAYADEKAAETAMLRGRNFMREDADVTTRKLSDMSEAERQFFKLGAMRAVRDKIAGAPDTADAYKRVFGNDLMRERLKSVIGDEEAFNAFKRGLEAEREMYATRALVTGNSATARRLAGMQDSNIDPNLLIEGAKGNIGGVVRGLLNSKALRGLLADEGANAQVADILLSTDPAKRQALARALMDRQQTQALWGNRLHQAQLASALLGGKASGMGAN